MKKKKILQVLTLFCFLSMLWGYASSQSSVSINTITVQTEELNTLIFLETSAPLRITGTYYAETGPATIVIDLDKVTTDTETQIDLRESLVVEDIKIEKTGAETARLLIQLLEKVPYRFYASSGYTVVELNRIQRTLNGYILTSETEEKLRGDTQEGHSIRGSRDYRENRQPRGHCQTECGSHIPGLRSAKPSSSGCRFFRHSLS